jgi:hypothetical protein
MKKVRPDLWFLSPEQVWALRIFKQFLEGDSSQKNIRSSYGRDICDYLSQINSSRLPKRGQLNHILAIVRGEHLKSDLTLGH